MVWERRRSEGCPGREEEEDSISPLTFPSLSWRRRVTKPSPLEDTRFHGLRGAAGTGAGWRDPDGHNARTRHRLTELHKPNESSGLTNGSADGL